MTKAKRKSTSVSASSASDRKQKRLVSFNSAPRKSVRQKRQQPTAADITAAVADEASQLILDRFGFENPSPPRAPPPTSKKKTQQKVAKATPKVTKTLATRRSPRLRKSLSLIEEADEEEKEEENYEDVIANESSPIKPPSKRRRITPEKPLRLIVRDTFEGTPDSEEEELNQIGGEIMGMDDASWRPATRRSSRQTPSSGQRRGRKDKKIQDNTLTQMSRDFHWNSDDEDDDDDEGNITVLSPSRPPNILNMPSTPHRQIRTVIPSSRSTGTPVSILRSGGKQPRSTQVSPSKKVRWIDQEDQENRSPQPISSPINPPSPQEITDQRVIPSSQWWENVQDQSLSQWDVDEVPTEDEANNNAEDPRDVDTATADNKEDNEDESQVIDHDEIAKSNFVFSKKLQEAAECSQKELKGLSPKHSPKISPRRITEATTPEAIPATPDVEDTPVTPRMPTQPNGEAQSAVKLSSRLEVADSEGEDEENDDWEVVDEPDAVVQESQMVLASAEGEETTSAANGASDLPASSPPGAPLTPRKNETTNMEGSERATSPDFSVIFETQSQSNTPTQSQQLPSQVKNTGGSSQYWDLSKTNHSSGMASSPPPLPHSSFTQQGYTQWKLNKFGPTQPSITVSQILGHSYSQDDDGEEKDNSKVQVQSSMIGSELV